ncbi:hypothetical protein [Actinoplanes subtropicus]|uniref:hypothetical protein n=1 Tax=Actinoplanes subtropicus TaxID=543632 RepID=UPI0004C36C97|nr:hypothetical protein [Actinoplanes subtropicus]
MSTPSPDDVVNIPYGEYDFSPTFTQDQANLAKSAISKMQAWRSSHPDSFQIPFDAAGLTDDEKSAFQSYEGMLDYYGDTPDASYLTPGNFDSNNQYGNSPATPPPADLPPPVNGGSDHNGQLAVNTDALKQFSKNLETLRGNITTAKAAIRNVVVKPGQFAAATKMSNTINGAGGNVLMSGDLSTADGLRGQVYNFLDNADKAFTELQTDIANLISQYKSVEDLNNTTAAQLTGAFQDAVTQMGTGTTA